MTWLGIQGFVAVNGVPGVRDAALMRYARHLLLPEIGIAGQEKLAASHCLLIGVGGLGCSVATQLCLSGLGQVSIADGDQVELSNLQRQPLFTSADIGVDKVRCAQARLQAMNPDCKVHPVARRLQAGEIAELAGSADLLIDCSDNYATRYACNDAARSTHCPLISGAAVGWRGLVVAFANDAPDTACYSCVFPPDTTAADENCTGGAVFAALPAIVGAWQAVAAIQTLTGSGARWANQLLTIDAINLSMRRSALRRDLRCPTCGG